MKSIEEKAKAYDDLLVKLQKAKVDNNVCDDRYCCVIDDIVPELKESEDERIKKVIKQVLSESTTEKDECYLDNGVTQQEVFDWLESQGEQPKKHDVCDNCDQQGCCVSPCPMKLVEKQGEQKPAWSEEDESMLYGVIETEQYMLDVVNGIKKFDVWNGDIRKACAEELNWLKSLKGRVQPKQEWSEDDERYLNNTISYLKDATEFKETAKLCIDWLKSLSPRNRWKPSEEQIEALLKLEEMHVLEHEKNQENAHLYMMVKSIREQLLKLREE